MPPEATPAAPPAAAPASAVPAVQTRSTRNFGTKPRLPTSVTATPAAAPAAAMPATPAVVKPAEPAKIEPPPAAKPEAGTTPETAPEPAKTITAGEAAKRLSDISRAEGNVVKAREILRGEREAFERDKSTHAADLKRIELLGKARATPKGAGRLAIIEQVFGWAPSDLLDDVVGSTVRTPEQIVSERVQTIDEKAAALTKQIEELDKRDRTSREQAQIDGWIKANIEPVLTPKDYPFLCDELGDKAVRQMYDVLNDDYRKTGIQPTAQKVKDVAATAEKWYRQEAERKAKLLGPSVTAGQPANQTAQGGTAPTPTTQSTPSRLRFQSAPPYRAKHRPG